MSAGLILCHNITHFRYWPYLPTLCYNVKKPSHLRRLSFEPCHRRSLESRNHFRRSGYTGIYLYARRRSRYRISNMCIGKKLRTAGHYTGRSCSLGIPAYIKANISSPPGPPFLLKSSMQTCRGFFISHCIFQPRPDPQII